MSLRDSLAELLQPLIVERDKTLAALAASLLILDRLQRGAGVTDEEIAAAMAQGAAMLDDVPFA